MVFVNTFDSEVCGLCWITETLFLRKSMLQLLSLLKFQVSSLWGEQTKLHSFLLFVGSRSLFLYFWRNELIKLISPEHIKTALELSEIRLFQTLIKFMHFLHYLLPPPLFVFPAKPLSPWYFLRTAARETIIEILIHWATGFTTVAFPWYGLFYVCLLTCISPPHHHIFPLLISPDEVLWMD